MERNSARSTPVLPLSERRCIRIMGNLCPYCDGEGVRYTVRLQAIAGRVITREIIEEMCRRCYGGVIA